MKPENFCYWLQGAFELFNSETLDKQQVDCIKNHLNLVFVHDIDPKQNADTATKLNITAEEAAELLGKIHDPNKIYRC